MNAKHKKRINGLKDIVNNINYIQFLFSTN